MTLANSAAESMLGLAPDEGTGRVIEPPPATAGLGEVVIPRPDGTAFRAELGIAVLEWEGEPATLVSIHDLSDRKCAERIVVAQTVKHAFLPGRTRKTSRSLREGIRLFTGSAPVHDDLTLVGIELLAR